MTTLGSHESLVATELWALDNPWDRRRFGATLRAVVDAAEIYEWDLDDVQRDATVRAIEAKYADDLTWRCWRALAESAQLHVMVDQIESRL